MLLDCYSYNIILIHCITERKISINVRSSVLAQETAQTGSSDRHFLHKLAAESMTKAMSCPTWQVQKPSDLSPRVTAQTNSSGSLWFVHKAYLNLANNAL